MNRHFLNNRWVLTLALLLPIVVLAGNAWLHHQQRESGEKIVLPIKGFDPRDLLSGHYLIYEIDYGITGTNDCPASHIEAAVCLTPERRIFPSDELPESCMQFIRGNCNDKARFVTGLERFYIPEQHAGLLEKYVQNSQGKIVLSLDEAGNAAIRDLLIDDQPWKEIIENE